MAGVDVPESMQLVRRVRARLLPYRSGALAAADIAAWFLGFIATARLSLGPNGAGATTNGLIGSFMVIVLVQLAVGRALGLYHGRFRVGGYDEAVAVGKVWFAVAAATSLLELALSPDNWLAETPALFRSAVALAIMAGVRLLWRLFVEKALRPDGDGLARVVVLGAGEAGYLIIRGMLTDPASRYTPVALLDDDRAKRNRTLMGVQVEGTIDDLPEAVSRHQAKLVIIAIPSASSALIGRVIDMAREAGVEVRTLPPTSELVGGVTLRDVRPINDDDLLGRAQVVVDFDQIGDYVNGKRVLVTGAGGSIGGELCRQLARLELDQLIMLDRDETGLHSTQLAIEQRALLDNPALVVADIRDRERIFQVFEHWMPQVVFHAAALKHLTLLELHPSEGVKTNVLGSQNVIDAAVKIDAECVVNVSTDKAADPTSVLGVTKLMAEQYAAEMAQRSDARIVSVRFGNVLGSRGSVLPTFLSQIEAGGPVTVTDPEVTRFFMTIPEAVRLVLQAGAIGDDGEIMIFDMGEPVRIVDLAHRLIAHHNPAVDIEFTGLRPGEKLHEVLVADNETGITKSHPRIFHTESVKIMDVDRELEGLFDGQAITPGRLLDLIGSRSGSGA